MELKIGGDVMTNHYGGATRRATDETESTRGE